MASGDYPRDVHSGDAPPDDDDAPRDARGSDGDDAPVESGGAAAHERSDESEPRDKRGRLEGFIPDIVKRTFYAGLGAVFTTEEGIRKIASDLKLPKDVANYLIQQAASSKDELFRVVGKEMRGFLESVNISGELQKLLTSLSFEIKTEIRFIPNAEAIAGIKPDVKVGRMSFRRNKDRDKDKDKERDQDDGASKKPGDKDQG
ncbi:MAG: hypothetical protein JWM53_6154 [bacterium]|nr:hypothetical protein [bacterium]